MTMIAGMMLAAGLLLECENFSSLGGWTVETQSMRQLGSSYVMAHGYGQPVADAWTTADFPEAAEKPVGAAGQESRSDYR